MEKTTQTNYQDKRLTLPNDKLTCPLTLMEQKLALHPDLSLGLF
jgi:hypothetical protein